MLSLLTSGFLFISRKKFLLFDNLFDIPMVIKNVSVPFSKITVLMLVFIVTNHLSYFYFGLGSSMGYGVACLVSLPLLSVIWMSMTISKREMTVGHSPPLGVQGVLKIPTPPIEIPGILIRPATLAIRLATNISRGHVVLSMFSYFMVSDSAPMYPSVSSLLSILFLIEFLVCVIQAHVSRSLLLIYLVDIEIQ